MLERQRRRVRDSLPLLVLITDGRANFSRGGDPVEEALRAARRVAEAHIPAVVIDTERQFVSWGWRPGGPGDGVRPATGWRSCGPGPGPAGARPQPGGGLRRRLW